MGRIRKKKINNLKRAQGRIVLCKNGYVDTDQKSTLKKIIMSARLIFRNDYFI